MASDSPVRASVHPETPEMEERDSRVAQALLRVTVDNLRANRLVAPVFALAVCAIFSQWTGPAAAAAWLIQLLAGFAPQFVLLWRFPRRPLARVEARRWTVMLAAANLFFIANWASLGWHFWVPGLPANHLMIELVLAATLAGHASTTGPCRALARPALLLYLAAMMLAPLRTLAAHPGGRETAAALLTMLAAALYVAFAAFIGRGSHARARATVLLGEERDLLLAELVMAKLDSDRGRERAEAASLAKSQFLANMSHELRTPLNAILGFSEMIASRMFQDQPERTVEYAGLIHASGRHLLALINDVLDLAKIEAGRWKLEETPLDLGRLAEDALQLVDWRARDNGVSLETAIGQEVGPLLADERAIRQILINLLSNAVKFTLAEGRVTVFARIAHDGGLDFGVDDTGVGIAADDRDRVFDNFGQGRHNIALADKGTGLGLAIVRGLAEAHGGHVSLESEIGKGTRVTVHMPASRLCPRGGAMPSVA